MDMLEGVIQRYVKVRIGPNITFDIERPTFQGYLYTPLKDGKVVLSELHFVKGKKKVIPLGTYVPNVDTTSDIDSVTYKITTIPASRLDEITRMVYESSF